MRTAAKVEIVRKAIRIANSFVNLSVLIVVSLLLAFSCYAIWDSGQVHSAASAGNYTLYKPTAEDEGASFEDLRANNPDVFAWLTVYGTNIDYPVVQGQNNIKYVNTDAKGKHSLSGAIFLDYRSGPNFSDFSSILYGHHMENQVMFGEIARFSNKNYFDAHRYGALYIDGKEHGLEFFAFAHTDAYDFKVFRVNITEQEDKQAYLDLLMQIATNTRDDVSVTTDDRIVLLSTCSSDSTNGRDILVAKITDTVPDNPFEIKEADSPRTIPSIDELSDVWTRTALWIKICIAGVLPLLILTVLVLKYTKRKRS